MTECSNVSFFRNASLSRENDYFHFWLKPVVLLVSLLLVTSFLIPFFSNLSGISSGGSSGSLLSDASGSAGAPDILKALLFIGAVTFVAGCSEPMDELTSDAQEATGMEDADPYLTDNPLYEYVDNMAGEPVTEKISEDVTITKIPSTYLEEHDDPKDYVDEFAGGVSLAKARASSEYYGWEGCEPFGQGDVVMLKNGEPRIVVEVIGDENYVVYFNEAFKKEYEGRCAMSLTNRLRDKFDLGNDISMDELSEKVHYFEYTKSTGEKIIMYEELCDGIYYINGSNIDEFNFYASFSPDKEVGSSIENPSRKNQQ